MLLHLRCGSTSGGWGLLVYHLQLGDDIAHGLHFGHSAAADQVLDLGVWIDSGRQAQGDKEFIQRHGSLLSDFGEGVTALDFGGR